MKAYSLAISLAIALYAVPASAQKANSRADTNAPRANDKVNAQATTVDIEKWTQQVIERTNAERTKRGLPPLKRQENLQAAARWLAQDMADHNYFDHTDRKGRNIDPRLPDFGYKPYQAIGENIAAGQSTPAAVVAGWMKSPGHRANILNPSFREIGVGFAMVRSGKYRSYWVQDFGARRSR